MIKSNLQKNYHLEVLRGVAASFVILGHLVDKIPEISKYKNHFINIFANWATESVIIFFVLSGLVIHSSFEKKPRKWYIFLYERLVRLHPTLLIAMSFTLFVDFFIFNNSFSLTKFISNLIPISTLNNGIATVYWQSNPVIWSLSFEVFFYLVFSAVIFKKSKINYIVIYIWLALGLIALPLFYLSFRNAFLSYLINMLAFSTIWIIGFLCWKLKTIYSFNFSMAIFSLLCMPLISRLHITSEYYDPIKYTIFAIVSIPLFGFLTQKQIAKPDAKKNAVAALLLALVYFTASILIFCDDSYGIIVKGLYSVLPFVFLIFKIRRIKYFFVKAYSFIMPSFHFIGSISYSLYILHYPIMMAIYYKMPGSVFSKIPIILTAIFLTCYLNEKYVQKFFQKTLIKN